MIQNINPQQLRDWIACKENLCLIDVREEWEHSAYNIGGQNIPLGELIARKNELPQDKKLVFYCEKGIRSVIAIQRLQLNNDAVFNLEGGMSAWRKSAG